MAAKSGFTSSSSPSESPKLIARVGPFPIEFNTGIRYYEHKIGNNETVVYGRQDLEPDIIYIQFIHV